METIRQKIRDIVSNMGIMGELLMFLWRAKMWWLIPMIMSLLIFGVIVLFASSGPARPMIYTLF